MINQSLSPYQTRKIDAEDLKIGDKFWDAKDGCFYEVAQIEHLEIPDFDDHDIGIYTNPPNKRRNSRIRKDRFTKVTIQETRF